MSTLPPPRKSNLRQRLLLDGQTLQSDGLTREAALSLLLWESYRSHVAGEEAWARHDLQHLTEAELWQELERARLLLA